MNSHSLQDIILAARNREEIIKLSKYHEYLSNIENDLIERKLKDYNEMSKDAARKDKIDFETLLRVEHQRKVLQKLFIETQEALKRQAANKSNIETAVRLIEKLNYMRRLTLILLSNTDAIDIEFVLAVSRDLINNRSLQHYVRNREAEK